MAKKSEKTASSSRPGKARTDKAGRPLALSSKVQKEIIDCVELLGMAETRAYRACGFDETTGSKWKTRGRLALAAWDKLAPEKQESEAIYVEFFKALRDAEPKFERANLTIIQNAAVGGDWRAADRRLAFKFPDRFGKRVMIAGDPKNPTPIPTVQTTSMSEDERKRRARRVMDAFDKQQPKKG